MKYIEGKTAGSWLSPLYEVLKKRLLSSNYLMADETPMLVLSEVKPGAVQLYFSDSQINAIHKLVHDGHRIIIKNGILPIAY
jgi:hypothetical protein